MGIEKSYRGISQRLARRYLSDLGGDVDVDAGETGGERGDDWDVAGENWRASLSAETVEIGPTVTLTEVTVVFEGEDETLEALVEEFSQKAMRAGG